VEEPSVGDGAAALRDAQVEAARFVEDLAGSAYGPRGMAKLVQQGDQSYRFVTSGATALREALQAHPDVAPYAELAGAVTTHAGDQATAGVLLAAGIVRRLLEAGLPRGAVLDGLGMAEKQARAVLASLATPDPDATCLTSIAPNHPGWDRVVQSGLKGLVAAGHLDLDAVDVRVEDVEAPQWLDGVVVEPQYGPLLRRGGPVKVLLVFDDWKPFLYKEDLQYTIRAGSSVPHYLAMEDDLRMRAVDHVVGLGVGLVVCANEVDPWVADVLSSRGVRTWNDAPKPALERLRKATGASRVMRPQHATSADVGEATLVVRERGGFLAVGSRPSATLGVPGHTQPARDEACEVAEKLVRGAGLWMSERKRLPGGGRWQRAMAHSLRQAADAAPGKAPLVLKAAGAAADALADQLVVNAGKDPLSTSLLPDADSVWDGARAVRVAVGGAFELARGILRLDNRFQKRVSDASYIRGTTGRPTKVEAGDVPPDM
jgi:chaperonin GroEL (HSP60 family)